MEKGKIKIKVTITKTMKNLEKNVYQFPLYIMAHEFTIELWKLYALHQPSVQ